MANIDLKKIKFNNLKQKLDETTLQSGNKYIFEVVGLTPENLYGVNEPSPLAKILGSYNDIKNVKFDVTITLPLNSHILDGLFDSVENLSVVKINLHKNGGEFDLHVSSVERIFNNCINLSTIGGNVFDSWTVSEKATNISYAFANCQNLTVPLDKFFNKFVDRKKPLNATKTFYNCKKLTGNISFELEERNWNLETADSMFEGCSEITAVSGGFSNNIVSANYMFKDCVKYNGLNGSFLSSKFPKLTSAISMFENTGITKLAEASYDPMPNVVYADSLFKNCKLLTDVSAVTFEFVESTSHMFEGCSALTNISAIKYISSSDTSYMFKGCSSLSAPNLNIFKNTQNIVGMFDGCTHTHTCDLTQLKVLTDITESYKNCSLSFISFGKSYQILKNFTNAFASDTPRTSEIFISVDGEAGVNWINENREELGFLPTEKLVISNCRHGNYIPYRILDDWILNQNTDTTPNLEVSITIGEFPDDEGLESGNGPLLAITGASSILVSKLNTLKDNISVDLQVEIPDHYTSLQNAFYGCRHVKHLHILGGAGLKDLQETQETPGVFEAAFSNMPSLESFESLSLFPNVKFLCGTFMSNPNLKSVNLRGFENVTNLYQICKGDISLTTINLGYLNQPLEYGKDAFVQCQNLTRVYLPYFKEATSSYLEVLSNFLARGNTSLKEALYLHIKSLETKQFIENNRRPLGIDVGQNIIYNIPNVIEYAKLQDFFDLLDNSEIQKETIVDLEVISIPKEALLGINTIQSGYEKIETSEFVKKFNNLTSKTTFNITMSFPEDCINASYCFVDTNKFNSLQIHNADSVKTAEGMFLNNKVLKEIDASKFKNVENAKRMFEGTLFKEIDTSEFAKVKFADRMFKGCINLTQLDLYPFTSVNVINNMLEGCTGLSNIDTSSFKLVTFADYFIKDCINIKAIDLTSFASNLKSANGMLENTSISEVNTALPKVTNAKGFLKGTKIQSFDFTLLPEVIDVESFFENCKSLTYIEWAKLNEHPGINVTKMFLNADSDDQSVEKVINCTSSSEGKFIHDNATKMELKRFRVETPIPDEISYNEIDNYLTSFIPQETPYDLTINDIPALSLVGVISENEQQSEFGLALEKFQEGVTFNLTIDVPIDATSINGCLIGNTKVVTLKLKNAESLSTAIKFLKNNKIITNVDTSIGFSKITDMTSAFENTLFESIDVFTFNSVNTSNRMFANSNITSIDCSGMYNIVYAKNMFENCTKLTSVKAPNNSLRNVLDASNMFKGCSLLTSVPFEAFISVKNATSMFEGSGITFVDSQAFTNVSLANSMFANTAIAGIDLFNFTSLTNAENMFKDCVSLSIIECGKLPLSIDSLPSFMGMFDGCISKKIIGVAIDTQVYFFEDNKTNLKLDNYSYRIEEQNLPTIIPYKYLGVWVDYFNPIEEKIFDLTVTEIPNGSVFIENNEKEAEFNTKLKAFKDFVLFNLSFEIPVDATSLNNSFKNNTHIVKIKVAGTTPTTSQGFLAGATKLTSVDYASLNLLTDTSSMFDGCENLIEVIKGDSSNIENAKAMFNNCKSLKSFSLADFIKLTTAENMFSGCSSLATIEIIDGENLKLVTNATSMFEGCRSLLSIDSSYFVNVTLAKNMFKGCEKIKNINTASLSKVVNASGLFDGCIALKSIDASPFTLVEDASFMFRGTEISSIDINTMVKAAYLNNMFENCTKISKINLKNIDFYNIVNTTSEMFKGCSGLSYVFPGSLNNLEKKTFKDMFATIASNTIYFATPDKAVIEFIKTYKDVLGISNPSINKVPYELLDDYLTVIEEPIETEIYDLEVTNIINTSSNPFKGDTQAHLPSEFGNKLLKTVPKVFFNLTFEVPGGTDTIESCFDAEGGSKTPLVSVNITSSPAQNIDYAFNMLDTLKSIVTNMLTSAKTMRGTFRGCTGLTEINTDFVGLVSDATSAFENCTGLTKVNTGSYKVLTTAVSMYKGCTGITTIGTSLFNTVTNATSMFEGCTLLADCDLSGFSNVEIANSMFKNCLALVNCNNLVKMVNLVDATSMFENCTTLGSENGDAIDVIFIDNKGNDTNDKLRISTNMFKGASKVKKIKLNTVYKKLGTMEK